MSDGLNTFLRFANLFGNPDDMSGDMPAQLPVGPRQPQLINRQGPSISVSDAYDEGPAFSQQVLGDDYQERPTNTLDLFRQSVMNPPKRTQMTYPKNTLAGLTEALKIAATPTDYEKNRVYVDGQAHQQVRAIKDPTTGQIRYVNKYKQPGFMEQVMKAMPAAVSPAVDILNQPYEDAVADWEMRNKGLTAAVNAEANMALAGQRQAQAGYTAQRADIERDKIAISRMTAEERVRASRLKTLTDEELQMMITNRQITIADANNAAAMRRVEVQQAGATQRTGMQQEGATQRTGMQQSGANYRVGQQQAGADRRVAAQQAGANQRNAANISARGQSGYQERLRQQQNAAEFINQNPEAADYISFDAQGFPTISEDMPDELKEFAYEAIHRPPRRDVVLPAPPQTGGTPAPIQQPQPTVPPPSVAAPTTPKQPPKQQSAVDPKTKMIAERQKAASDLLRENNKPVTPANIRWVIENGMVK